MNLLHGFGRTRSIVNAVLILITGIALASCAGDVTGSASVDIGVIKGNIDYKGKLVANPGALTDTGGTVTKDGKVYKVYKDADGKLYVFDSEWGYILILRWAMSDATTRGPDDPNTLTDATGIAVNAIGIHGVTPITLNGVHIVFNTEANTARLDGPIVTGLHFLDPTPFHATLFQEGNRFIVTGTPNAVQQYGMAIGFRRFNDGATFTTFSPNQILTIRDSSGQYMGWLLLPWRTVRDANGAVLTDACGPIFEDLQ